MEWTIDRARETDARVRRSLSHSRADLVQFIAEGGWRMLPNGPSTAAAYVQDAAGVKRSEAYRIVATARISLILLSRMAEDLEPSTPDGTGEPVPITIDLYAWILRDVIKSTHIGEYLCSVTHEVLTSYEAARTAGTQPWEAVRAAVEEHPRPTDEQLAEAAAQADASGGVTEYPDGSAAAGVPAEDDTPRFPDVESLERAERVLICPHCKMPLR